MPDGDDIPKTDPTGSPPAAPAPQPTAPTITPEIQAIIDAEKQKAHDAGAAAARRALEGKQKPEARKADPTPTSPTTNVADELAFRDELSDALAAHAHLTQGQRRLLREAAITKRPQDVGSYVAQYVEDAGWKPAQNPTPAPQQPAPAPPAVPATPAPAPAAAHSLAPSHPAPAGSTQPNIPGSDLTTLSKSQQAAYLASAGYDKRNPYSPQSRAAAHKLRLEIESKFSNVRVRGPDE